MMTKEDFSHLPKATSGCLYPLAAGEIATAFVAAHRDGCSRADAISALSEMFAAEPALDEAVSLGLVQERNGLLHGAGKPVNWADARRDFAFRALGLEAAVSKETHRDLAGAALRQLYGLANLPPSPSRAQARCELLRRIVASFGEGFVAAVGQPGKAFSFDPMSRSIYFAFAGLSSGTVLQADAVLLSSAFGGPASTVGDLSTTIIRAALQANAAESAKREEVFNLDGFAESVRKLAGNLETKPYAGRVAIAQVYDAGLAQGLDLGTLDEFKFHLADAAREGLLDLERYDIAGPFDASLKERSRLRFGRDERHFIVNQWI
jgi:hypothetical protein